MNRKFKNAKSRTIAAIRAYPYLKAAENQRSFPYHPPDPGAMPGKAKNARPTESAALKADADAKKITDAVEEALRICEYIGGTESDIRDVISALYWQGDTKPGYAVAAKLGWSEAAVARHKKIFCGVLAALLDKNSDLCG